MRLYVFFIFVLIVSVLPAQETVVFKGDWSKEQFFERYLANHIDDPETVVSNELCSYLRKFENDSAEQKWKRMLLWFDEKLKERPEWKERLLLQRGTVNILVGEWQKAYDDAQVLCEEMNSQTSSAWGLYAESAKALHKPEAFSYCRKAVFLDSPEVKQEYQKGIEARDKGNYKDARVHFLNCKEMLNMKKVFPGSLFLRDVCFIDYRLGRWDDLLTNISQIGYRWDPDLFSMVMPLAYGHEDELDGFFNSLGNLIEKEPLPIYYAWRARFYAFCHGFMDLTYDVCRRNAQRDLENALKPDPQDPDILTICAGTYFYLDDFEKCLEVCDVLEKKQFKNQTWSFWKAMALMRQGKNEAAIKPLKTYIQYCETCPAESNFNVSMGQAMLAICYAKQNQFEKAEQEFQKLDPCFHASKRFMVEMCLCRAQKKKFSREADLYLKEVSDRVAKGPIPYTDFVFIFLCAEHQYAVSNSHITSYLINARKFGQINILRFTPEMDCLSNKAARYALHLDESIVDTSSPVVYLETDGNEWIVLQDMLLR